jgi:type IV pilus assembly protein PilC
VEAEQTLLARLGRTLRSGKGHANRRHVVVLVRHLSTLLNAGLPLSKSLLTLAQQFEDSRIAEIVTQMSREVEAGQMLSSAMSLHPDLFSSLAINVVRAGEVGGSLPETLEQLADETEKKQALRRTMIGAMVYPAIVIMLAGLIVGFLLTYVVPTFEGIYIKMHLELPLVTRALLAASRAAKHGWWVPILAGVGSAVGLRKLKQLDGFRRWWDNAMLNVPIAGKLRRKAIASRFLSAFATLIGSGVSIVESLRLMSDLADNLVVREAIAEIRRHVCRGGRMSEPMELYSQFFSPMAIQMIGVGEETGLLPEAAKRTAQFLADEVEARIRTLTTLMEPLLTMGLGFVVGTIVLAIYLPMFDLMQRVSH